MQGAQRCFLAAQNAPDVHEAGVVGAAQDVGAGGDGVADLVLAHGGRYIGVLHGEGAAEATAFVGAGQLAQLQSLDGLQEAARSVAEAEETQAVAGGVVGHRVREVRADVGHSEDVDEELGELVGTGGEGRGRGVADLRVVLPDHGGTGSRGGHHILVPLEGGGGTAYERLGLGAVAGVVLGLPAAGLRLGEVDLHPEAFEEPHGRDPGGRIHRVVDAGDEEGDTHGRSICGDLRRT